MYNTLLQLLAGLTNVIGTTYAVLSILRLKAEDLYKSITIYGMDKNDESLLTQKKQARVGISLIVYAWILQLIFSFAKITSCYIFLICIMSYIVLTLILCFILYFLNKHFEKTYIEFRKKSNEEKQDRHIDSHTWQKF